MNVAQEWVAGADIPHLVERAQGGENAATEMLLDRFRPLLRARMHWLWAKLREEMSGVEWDDVEAQMQVAFLSRLRDFRSEQGVYFPYYIARMLEIDARDWLRQQQRQHAVPFSQLQAAAESSDDLEWWMQERSEIEVPDTAASIEATVSLQDAFKILLGAQREVVWHCCVRGHSESEVAERLGVSRSAVRNRLHGALERLRTFFGEGGAVTYPSDWARPTRTGRGRSTPGKIEFWMWRLNMTRDDKRPDLVGIGGGRPVMLQGVFDFAATGLKTPQLLSPKLRYVVPAGCVAGIRFLRAGVQCEALVCISTVVNGLPHRLVPVAANSASHVPFAIVEPIIAGSEIEIHIASDAPGIAVIDVGCLQMPA